MRQDYYDLKNQENKKLAAGVHVGALCRVEKFDPVAMTVDVQPLSKALDAAVYRTQPPVLGVPVALVRGAGFVVRPWYAAGDVGVILYIDHDIDRIVASGEESQPNTERNHSGDDGYRKSLHRHQEGCNRDQRGYPAHWKYSAGGKNGCNRRCDGGRCELGKAHPQRESWNTDISAALRRKYGRHYRIGP